MDWTSGTFWTVGNDAMDAGDQLWTVWTRGTGCGLFGRRGLVGAGAVARTHGLMRHGPMDWAPGTFWTVGNDAMDAGDRLWTVWMPGTDWRRLGAAV